MFGNENLKDICSEAIMMIDKDFSYDEAVAFEMGAAYMADYIQSLLERVMEEREKF